MPYATQYNTLFSCEKAIGANVALLSQRPCLEIIIIIQIKGILISYLLLVI